MNKHRWLIAALALAGLIGTLLFMWPVGQYVTESDTDMPIAPAFGSTIQVKNLRIALPERAGDPAMIYFDLTNVGEKTVQLTEVRLAHASATGMQDTVGPAWTPLANIAVEPGETVSFNPGGQTAVISNYDSAIVPGAMIDATLVFGTSGTVTVPAGVVKAI